MRPRELTRSPAVPVIQVRSDFVDKFHDRIELMEDNFGGFAKSKHPKKWCDKDPYTHHARATYKAGNIEETIRLTTRGCGEMISIAQKEFYECIVISLR